VQNLVDFLFCCFLPALWAPLRGADKRRQFIQTWTLFFGAPASMGLLYGSTND